MTAAARLRTVARRALAGPILVKELRTTFRTVRFAVVLSGAVALTAGLLLVVVFGRLQDDVYADAADVGRALFGLFTLTLAPLVLMLTPSFACTAVVGERERRSWDLLRVTALKPRQVVWGKFVAANAYVLVALVSALPLVAIAFLFGGVRPAELAAVYVGIWAAAVLLTAVCLWISTVVPGSRMAIAVAYLVTVGLTLPAWLWLRGHADAWAAGDAAHLEGLREAFARRGPVVAALEVLFFWGVAVAGCLVAAVNRLREPGADRAAAPRRLWLVLVGGTCAVAVLEAWAVPADAVAPGRAAILAAWGLVVWLELTLGALWFAGEAPGMAPRLRRRAEARRGAARVRMLLDPGSGPGLRLVLPVALAVGLAAAVAAQLLPEDAVSDPERARRVLAGGALLVTGWVVLTGAVARLGSLLLRDALSARSAAAFLLLVVAFVPFVHQVRMQESAEAAGGSTRPLSRWYHMHWLSPLPAADSLWSEGHAPLLGATDASTTTVFGPADDVETLGALEARGIPETDPTMQALQRTTRRIPHWRLAAAGWWLLGLLGIVACAAVTRARRRRGRGATTAGAVAACAAVLVLLGGPPDAAAQSAEEKLELDVDAGWGGRVQGRTWVPVRVEITRKGDPISGTLELVTEREGHSEDAPTMVVRMPAIAAEPARRYTLYVRSLGYVDAWSVRFVDDTGRERATVRPPSALGFRPLGPHQRILVWLGDDAPPASVSSAQVMGGQDPEAAWARATPEDLPPDLIGMDGVDAVVWNGPDARSLPDPRRLDVLEAWVRTGGTLVVCAPSSPVGLRTGLAADLLPVTVGSWDDLPGPDGADVRVCTGTLRPDAFAIETLPDGTPTVASRAHGSGRVVWLAWNPSLAGRDPGPGLWQSMAPMLRPLPQAEEEDVDEWGMPYSMRQAALPGTMLASALAATTKVELIGFHWIVLFVVVYIIVIGPLDWWVLKRINRRHWTWATFTLAVIVFSALAWWGSYRIKGGKMVRITYAFADQAPGAGGRQEAFTGLFSQSNATYDLSVPGDAILSPFSATGDGRELESLGMFGGRRTVLDLGADGTVLRDVPIRNWTLKQFRALRADPAPPMPAPSDGPASLSPGPWSATVERDADGMPSGEVSWNGDASVHAAVLVARVGERTMYWDLGRMDPGDTVPLGTADDVLEELLRARGLLREWRGGGDRTDLRRYDLLALTATFPRTAEGMAGMSALDAGMPRIRDLGLEQHLAEGRAVVLGLEPTAVPLEIEVADERLDVNRLTVRRAVVLIGGGP